MVLAALPQDTVRLIKSSQVITSPSSVVKELVENSLDASATTVHVKLEKFGLHRLEVRDNGSGIYEKDVGFVAQEHFTSKISSFADLNSLTSYGFRGEALSSLCAVSSVSITTKRKEDSVGYLYKLNHKGEVVSKSPAATPNGTTCVVTNLFKSVPVRHQYYASSKHCKDELKKIENILLALAVAVPGSHITLAHDRAVIFQKNASKDLQSVLMNIFPETCRSFVSRTKNIAEVSLEMYLPDPKVRSNLEFSRSSVDRFFVMVNKRPVSHKTIEKLAKVYFSQGPGLGGSHGRYPVGVVDISVPSESVDVNLEPNKHKVLLRDEGVIIEAIVQILEELYGSLEKHKKVSSQQGRSSGLSVCEALEDITCTFAGISQAPEEQSSSSIATKGKDYGNMCGEEFMDDEFLLHKEPDCFKTPLSNSISSHPGTGVVEVQRSNCSKHVDAAPKLVINRDEEFRGHSSFRMIIENDCIQTERSTVQQESNVSCSGATANSVTDGSVSCGTKLISLEKSMEREGQPKWMEYTCERDVSMHGRMMSTPVVSGDITSSDLSLSTIHASENSSANASSSHSLSREELSVNSPSFTMKEKSDLQLNQSEGGGVNFKVIENPVSRLASDCHVSGGCLDKDNLKPVHDSMDVCKEISAVEKVRHTSKTDKLLDLESNLSFNDSLMTEKQVKAIGNEQDKENCTHWVSCPDEEKEKSVSKIMDKQQQDGSWSRGTLGNGQNIQTVQLCQPQSNVGRSSSCKMEGKRPLLSLSSRAKQDSGIAPKKRKLEALRSTSFDYIHSRPIKKPSSAFIIFSRDIRTQVMSENPGGDFAMIAKILSDKWKVLDNDERKIYEDRAKADAERYLKEVREVKESRGLDTSLDTSNVSFVGNGTSLHRYVTTSSPQLAGKLQQPLVSKYPWKEHQKEVDVSLKTLREKIGGHRQPTSVDESVRLLGSATSEGGWLCLKDGIIYGVNVCRLQEVLICHNLFQSFRLPSHHLSDPVPFNESVIGADCWQVLTRLSQEKIMGKKAFSVTDRRLKMNGFDVVLHASTGDERLMSHGEIVSVSNVIAFYGLGDLKEILSMLVVHSDLKVGQSRPLKVQFWLKSEAVRMVRSIRNSLRMEEVLEKLGAWQGIRVSSGEHDKDQWENSKCFHDKTLFTPLYSLDDLPFSMSQRQTKKLNVCE